MSLHADAELVLTIDKPVPGGRMIARHEGQIVFVAGAVPGERVRARVTRVGKQLAFADTIEVLAPSPDRRGGDIDWMCGGSLYAHIAYPRQLTLKSELVADSFARIAKMTLENPVPMMGSDEQGYRMRARLHASNATFGFFREGTHELCDPRPTRQLLAATIDAIDELQSALKSAGITRLASCEISENVPADERAVLLAMEPSQPAPVHLEAVRGITGVLFADHESPRLSVAYGSPYVTDSIDAGGASAKLTHHVQSFFQGNRHLLSQLVERVLAQVPDGQVMDLYAGVGLFAVSLAAQGRHNIVAVESDRMSARDLESNAASSGGIRVAHMPVEAYLRRRRLERADTLVLDPPRTGMSREAMSGILALKAPRIVYVSCDLATLARDVKRLIDAGYHLDHMEGFDLFPNTPHVETLVVLTS